jgi:hypothetical protein
MNIVLLAVLHKFAALESRFNARLPVKVQKLQLLMFPAQTKQIF